MSKHKHLPPVVVAEIEAVLFEGRTRNDPPPREPFFREVAAQFNISSTLARNIYNGFHKHCHRPAELPVAEPTKPGRIAMARALLDEVESMNSRRAEIVREAASLGLDLNSGKLVIHVRSVS